MHRGSNWKRDRALSRNAESGRPIVQYYVGKQRFAQSIETQRSEKGAKMNKILVVEGDQGIRMLYADELNEEGYDVVMHEEGTSLLPSINNERPDLVVIDIKSGKCDSLDLLRDIRNTYHELPAIICTAYSSFRYRPKLAAVNDYVLKSPDLRELKLKISRALEGRQSFPSRRTNTTIEQIKSVPVEQMDFPWKGVH